MQHSRTQRKYSGNKRQTSSWAMPNRSFYQKKQRELPLIQACTCQRRFPGNGQSSLDCTRRRRHCTVTTSFCTMPFMHRKCHLWSVSHHECNVMFLKCDIHWSRVYNGVVCAFALHHCYLSLLYGSILFSVLIILSLCFIVSRWKTFSENHNDVLTAWRWRLAACILWRFSRVPSQGNLVTKRGQSLIEVHQGFMLGPLWKTDCVRM